MRVVDADAAASDDAAGLGLGPRQGRSLGLRLGPSLGSSLGRPGGRVGLAGLGQLLVGVGLVRLRLAQVGLGVGDVLARRGRLARELDQLLVDRAPQALQRGRRFPGLVDTAHGHVAAPGGRGGLGRVEQLHQLVVPGALHVGIDRQPLRLLLRLGQAGHGVLDLVALVGELLVERRRPLPQLGQAVLGVGADPGCLLHRRLGVADRHRLGRHDPARRRRARPSPARTRAVRRRRRRQRPRAARRRAVATVTGGAPRSGVAQPDSGAAHGLGGVASGDLAQKGG